MKDMLARINPAFDHRNRLGIMTVLVGNDWVEYVTLKGLLDLSDGNLASYLKSLEKYGYVTVRKEFVGRIPRTTYGATEEGRVAFSDHLDALSGLVELARSEL